MQRERTGQKHPSVVVENAFSTAQHVFVDWEHAARVEPRSSATLQLSAGTHTITSAESSDPDDRAVSVTESFEPDFRYTYEIVAE